MKNHVKHVSNNLVTLLKLTFEYYNNLGFFSLCST